MRNAFEPILRTVFVTIMAVLAASGANASECVASASLGSDVAPIAKEKKLGYPKACLAEAADTETVKARFNVGPDGVVNWLNVYEMTNECFKRQAVQYVAKWKYPCTDEGIKGLTTEVSFDKKSAERALKKAEDAKKRRAAKKKRNFVPNISRTVSCVMYNPLDATLSAVLDGHPAARACRPHFDYPWRCFEKANEEEFSAVTFDVSPKGKAKNIDLLQSSNNCFNKYAKKSVKQIRYGETEEGFEDIVAVFKYSASEVKPTKTLRRRNTAAGQSGAGDP
ncbi:MAG: hypothetical protein AAGB02_03815 [Pseudomonadota bacterium]